jgi:hypothetical protein
MAAILQIDDASYRCDMSLNLASNGPRSNVPENEGGAAVITPTCQKNIPIQIFK